MKDKRTLLLVVGALALGGLIMAAPKIISTVRGIRNHNPGNIERTGTQWQGMALDQSSDPRFIVFVAPEWGIRAIARILKNYVNSGYNTVRKIISRWAPPSENDTGAYVNAVANSVGIGPDTVMTLATLAPRLPGLVSAIIKHENGIQPYDAAVIAKGIALEQSA